MTSNTDLKKRPARPKRPARAPLAASGGAGDALYRQVVQVLKDEIIRGVHPVGTQLPTEEELCTRFSVSRYTVREALRRLREDRLVTSRQGAGTTVVPFDAADADLHQVTSINDLVTFAVGLCFDIQSMEMVVADAALAARIGGDIGVRWVMVRGYRQSEQSPLPACWAEVFVEGEFAAVGRLLKRNRGPIFQLIEDLFGQRVDEVRQQISASTIPPAVAAGLEVAPNSVALEVLRTYRLASGKVALVAINIHPAERFSHTMIMRRVKS